MTHLTPAELQSAHDYGDGLRSLVDGQSLPASPRSRAALACIGIALDHHRGILLLISNSLYASAFALVRPMFEAFVRGEWLASCASDKAVEEFMAGKEPPRFADLLTALEETDGFEAQSLSGIKNANWDAMCGYTHAGGIHVQRWQSVTTVEPSYERHEVLEVLRFAEVLLALSANAVFKQSQDVSAAEKALAIFRTRFGNT